MDQHENFIESKYGREPNLTLKDFAFNLPSNLIAQDPVADRENSRLLYYDRDTRSVKHLVFRDIASILSASDVIVINNTRVIPVRLQGRASNGMSVELFLVKHETDKPGLWQALTKPLKKLKQGDIIQVDGNSAVYKVVVEGTIISASGQKRLLVRLCESDNIDQVFAILKDAGQMPLPPYILQARRNDTSSLPGQEHNDFERYQTIFAKNPGAVAAPTAGLHFSKALLEHLQSQGVSIHEITLHVGPGTFKPITTSIEEHTVEPEWFSLSKETANSLNLAKQQNRRIIAVGTTTCRALESSTVDGELKATDGSYTSLFIKPGYQFKFIDGLITNFHLSESSLLLLVAAILGKDELMRIYKTAIDLHYRFYSYGDAMIIL